MPEDSLADFDQPVVDIDGIAKRVYVSGSGPAVVVMSEMPGISPHVARFARWVRDAGMTVYMPSLFGRDGAAPDADEGAAVFRRVCVSAEFRAFGGGESSPGTRWLVGLARRAYDECGGRGVGAVGMCFTGNFALTMMLDPAVIGAVLCQPSLPLDAPDRLEISDAELSAVRDRLVKDDLTVLGYRFEGDRVCTRARFNAYARALGDRFVGRTLPDSAASTDVPSFFAVHVPFPHSVVTAHLIDRDGEPTLAARDEIIAFLRRVVHVERDYRGEASR